MAAITSDELLARIKARAQIPAAESRLSTAEIFAIVDDLIVTSLGRSVFDADDGRWLVTAADVAVTSGVSTYRIPSRAWAGGLVQALLVNANGQSLPLNRVDHADVWQYDQQAWNGQPAYALMGDVVRLLPAPSDSSYSLRLRYIRRPSKLALVADCAVVDTGGVASGALTVVDTMPTSWSGTTRTIDVVEANNNVEALEDSVSVTESSYVLTRASGSFATSGAYAVSAGDYICDEGTTCVVQVPDVAIGHLSVLAAQHVCIALGDRDGAANLSAAVQTTRSDMDQAIARRTRSGPRAIPWGSPLRNGSQGRRWRWSR